MASEDVPKSYYAILGMANNASTCAIRNAYRKLAMKWHPDKCSGGDLTSAKLKFQEIQEAYSVLSDTHKKALYDIGLYDPDDDDEDVEGLGDFITEMSGMMAEVQASKDSKGTSFQELQQLFMDIFKVDVGIAAYHGSGGRPASPVQCEKKRSWGMPPGTSFVDDIGACFVDGKLNSPSSHVFFTATFDGVDIDANAAKKKKSTSQERFATGVSL